jgi:SlyX protein
MTDLQAHEERIAHLTRTVDDLSEVVARQARQIEVLERRMEMLMRRAAEAEAAEGGTVTLTDRRPPHW